MNSTVKKMDAKNKEHYEKQTHKSFWKHHCNFTYMQAWFAYFVLRGKSFEEATKLAATKKGYPKN